MGLDLKNMSVAQLFEELNEAYSGYLSKFGLVADDDFYLHKLSEELGELSRAFLAHKAQHPKIEPPIDNAMLEEEAADLFCQIIIFITRNELDVTKTIYI